MICISLMTLVMFSLSTAAFGGQNLFKAGDAEAPDAASAWDKPVSICTTDKKAGKASFETSEVPIILISKELIPVDSSKKYELSAFLKSASGSADDPSVCSLGLAMFDVNKRSIIKSNAVIVPDTETVLVEAAVKGETTIAIADGSKWEKRRSIPTAVAFNAKPELADLPNYEYSSSISVFTKNDNGSYKLKLSKPLAKGYPAGTKVRQHHSGFLQPVVAVVRIPAEWTEYKMYFEGVSTSEEDRDKFWQGTKYVKIFIIANMWGRKGPRLLFDNIEFKEIEK